MVPKNHFEEIWNAAPEGKRAAFLTPYRHSANITNRKVYRLICEKFIQSNSIDSFIDKLERYLE